MESISLGITCSSFMFLFISWKFKIKLLIEIKKPSKPSNITQVLLYQGVLLIIFSSSILYFIKSSNDSEKIAIRVSDTFFV